MEEDGVLQDRLLKKLQEYGDSLLDEEVYSTRKAQAKQAKAKPDSGSEHSNNPNKPERPPSQISVATKKKKKKKKKTTAVLNLTEGANVVRNKTKGQVVDFDEELRLFKEEQLEKERRRQEEERGKGADGQRPAPEVIVFEDPSRRKRKKIDNQGPTESSQDEFNLKRARYEVRQFGLTGFSFEDRERCEADRAVRLGAWAPKREYINYKEYMATHKKKKEEERQQREIDRKMGYSVTKKPTAEKIRIKNHGFWKDPTQDKKFFLDGQIGKYKQGVQVVSKDDIARTKARQGRRGRKSKKVKF